MSTTSGRELALEIAAIRQQMAARRLVIAERVDPPADETHSFPRSKTMRMIVRDPRFATGLFAGATALFLATRLLKKRPMLPLLAGVIRLASLLRKD